MIDKFDYRFEIPTDFNPLVSSSINFAKVAKLRIFGKLKNSIIDIFSSKVRLIVLSSLNPPPLPNRHLKLCSVSLHQTRTRLIFDYFIGGEKGEGFSFLLNHFHFLPTPQQVRWRNLTKKFFTPATPKSTTSNKFFCAKVKISIGSKLNPKAVDSKKNVHPNTAKTRWRFDSSVLNRFVYFTIQTQVSKPAPLSPTFQKTCDKMASNIEKSIQILSTLGF